MFARQGESGGLYLAQPRREGEWEETDRELSEAWGEGQ